MKDFTPAEFARAIEIACAIVFPLAILAIWIYEKLENKKP